MALPQRPWLERARDAAGRLRARADSAGRRGVNITIPLPSEPQWLINARFATARRAEAAVVWTRLWWLATSEPIAAAIAERARKWSHRFEEARDRLSRRLRPYAQRLADRWERRARKAADRRAELVHRLAQLRDRHITPVVRAIEAKVPVSADEARSMGLTWPRVGLGVLTLLIGAWACWRMAPDAIPEASADEIRLTGGFVTQDAKDPTAWMHAVGR